MKTILQEHIKSHGFINDNEVDKLINKNSGKCKSNLQRKQVKNSDNTTSQEYGYLISDLITPLTYTNVSGFESLKKNRRNYWKI
jgi:hypothetical protein